MDTTYREEHVTVEGRKHIHFDGVKRGFVVITGFYLIAIAVLVILSVALARNVGLIGIVRSALVFSLWLALPLALIDLLLYQWRWAALLAVPVLGLIFIFAPYFVPRSQSAVANKPVLTVLTLNVHKPRGAEANKQIATLIGSIDADIVALQELGPDAKNNMGPLLIDQYPYQSFHQDEAHPGSGQGILSKEPILSDDYWKAGGPWNGNLRVEIDFQSTRVTVYNIHPHPPIERGLDPQMDSHAHVLRDALDRASKDSGPVLLIGDFNMTEQFAPYQWIAGKFTDAYRAVGTVGLGFTHPTDIEGVPSIPLWRIDYIFYDNHFRGLDARTFGRSGSTDHLPLLARLQIVQ